MPANEATRIRLKPDAYAADPKSQANNVKALVGRPEIRLCVGDWRVVMRETTVILVVSVGSRASIY